MLACPTRLSVENSRGVRHPGRQTATPGTSTVLRLSHLRCRPQSGEQDEVAAGALHNNVLQRMKLNNKVALITGDPPL